MKTFPLLVCAGAFALGAGLVCAQPDPALTKMDRPGATAEMHDVYVRNAVLQIQAYRWELDAAQKAAPADTRWGETSRWVKELEVLVARLRSASPSEFEAVKAMFERTRTALDRSLGKSD